MKRQMRWVLWLYPRAWRDRYAAEFAALLEDVGWSWSEWRNVAAGGLKMRMLTWNLASVAVACAVLGAGGGIAWSLRAPEQYVSTAVLRVKGEGATSAERLQSAQTRIFSRGSLADIIQRYDLYRSDRMRFPMEDVISEVRNRDIRVVPVRSGGETSPGTEQAFSISFQYPDAANAQRVTKALTERFQRDLGGVDVLDPPSLPTAPSSRRFMFILAGLAIGLAAGAALFGIRRWPIVAVSGAAAAGLAVALSFVWQGDYFSVAMVAGNSLSVESVRAILAKHNPSDSRVGALRLRDLTVSEVKLVGGGAAVAIKFRSRDRVLARDLVQEAVTAIGGAAEVRVAVPVQVQQRPVSWNRSLVLLYGLAAGLALGTIVTWLRHPRVAAA
jgi:hypothetical protein